MARNILIFFPYPLQENCGGPFTYLFHLKNAFPAGDIKLVFLNELIHLPALAAGAPARPPSFIKRLVKRFIPSRVLHSRRVTRYLDQLRAIPYWEELKKINYNEYDAIHFHESNGLYRFGGLLKDYKGKIIFMPHAPKPFFLEILEDVLDSGTDKVSPSALNALQDLDRSAFKGADIILWPCREAMEAYENLWKEFKGIVLGKILYFLPTGVPEPVITEPAAEVRKNFSIPANAFVVCFNGRHKSVKGFDLLEQAALTLLHAHSDIFILVTGKPAGARTITHERWIETGWTEAPQNMVNAADLVVVPNRETLFDLNVLMVLSLGKPILLSETGGNKYFKPFASKGIYYFDVNQPGGLAAAIEKAYANRGRLAEEGMENKKLHQEYFTDHRMAEDYVKFYGAAGWKL